MKSFLKRLVPDRVQIYLLRSPLFSMFKNGWRYEGFLQRYCQGHGLDIGYGGDLVCSIARGWDIEEGEYSIEVVVRKIRAC